MTIKIWFFEKRWVNDYTRWLISWNCYIYRYVTFDLASFMYDNILSVLTFNVILKSGADMFLVWMKQMNFIILFPILLVWIIHWKNRVFQVKIQIHISYILLDLLIKIPIHSVIWFSISLNNSVAWWLVKKVRIVSPFDCTN